MSPSLQVFYHFNVINETHTLRSEWFFSSMWNVRRRRDGGKFSGVVVVVVVMYEIYLPCLLGAGPWSVIISKSHLNRTEKVRVGLSPPPPPPSIFRLGGSLNQIRRCRVCIFPLGNG